jgi:CheY-like chemotaxis protein
MDNHKPFIIVVDDDNEDRYLLHSSFAELGLDDNVKYFGDALQFMRYMELISSLPVHPSLFLLDYRMPYMHGKGLLTYLKVNSAFRDVPVVVFSSEVLDADTKEKLADLGVSACYQKGLTQEEIIESLREMLKMALPV